MSGSGISKISTRFTWSMLLGCCGHEETWHSLWLKLIFLSSHEHEETAYEWSSEERESVELSPYTNLRRINKENQIHGGQQGMLLGSFWNTSQFVPRFCFGNPNLDHLCTAVSVSPRLLAQTVSNPSTNFTSEKNPERTRRVHHPSCWPFHYCKNLQPRRWSYMRLSWLLQAFQFPDHTCFPELDLSVSCNNSVWLIFLSTSHWALFNFFCDIATEWDAAKGRTEQVNLGWASCHHLQWKA